MKNVASWGKIKNGSAVDDDRVAIYRCGEIIYAQYCSSDLFPLLSFKILT